MLLLLGSFAVIGLAVSQDESPAAYQELSQLQATVTQLSRASGKKTAVF